MYDFKILIIIILGYKYECLEVELECPAGSFLDIQGVVEQNECIKCPVNTYSLKGNVMLLDSLTNQRICQVSSLILIQVSVLKTNPRNLMPSCFVIQ